MKQNEVKSYELRSARVYILCNTFRSDLFRIAEQRLTEKFKEMIRP